MNTPGLKAVVAMITLPHTLAAIETLRAQQAAQAIYARAAKLQRKD
jgi:hypothetical protein